MASAVPAVSVIVPALNEASSLREVFARTKAALEGRYSFEFIVVDDGSTDDTAEVVKSMRAENPCVAFIRHRRNHGKSLTLMQGFDCARADIAVTIDADLQDPPEAIPDLIAELDRGFDLVGGWRKDRRDAPAKIWVSRLFNLLTNRIFRCALHDVNCGLKAMRRPLYKSLQLQGDLHRLIPVIAGINGFKVSEIPLPHASRRYGASRYHLLRHRGLLDILALMGRSSTEYRPFHAFSEAGFVCWVLALAAAGLWAGLTLRAGEASLWFRIARPLAGGMGLWAAATGTVLPFFGFYLDVIGRHFQDSAWRLRLIQEKLDPGP